MTAAVSTSPESCLTKTQRRVLDFLQSRAGEVVSRDELAAEIWKQHFQHTRTIDQTVAMVRKRLTGASIAAVRGVGYKYIR